MGSEAEPITHHPSPLVVKLTPVMVVLALIGGLMVITDPSVRTVELGMGMNFLDVMSMVWLVTFAQVMIVVAGIQAGRGDDAE